MNPMMSGVGRAGCAVIDWKIAPLTPSAAPNTSAAATRGSRHSTTMSCDQPGLPAGQRGDAPARG